MSNKHPKQKKSMRDFRKELQESIEKFNQKLMLRYEIDVRTKQIRCIENRLNELKEIENNLVNLMDMCLYLLSLSENNLQQLNQHLRKKPNESIEK
ncbi:hypothetical protein DERP_007792 [Dermatophagoides pteronyssinus]|uniref:Uncharacterized protein n=1 Tax=Dermatophagoides pteronyssinus TaxID=6956 RepID=A0ABQ8ISL9_DERPT|nr:hypothetical protein DERP_007792 [Dermatophagoides pteronyssinus]